MAKLARPSLFLLVSIAATTFTRSLFHCGAVTGLLYGRLPLGELREQEPIFGWERRATTGWSKEPTCTIYTKENVARLLGRRDWVWNDYVKAKAVVGSVVRPRLMWLYHPIYLQPIKSYATGVEVHPLSSISF
ncbi:hypothetical protein Acr_24g0013300 [Actinidia rufa]|uniref:Uncharacterized protein n=1 Tax=Actinidia rufa TaxID=165716 RepID=A0A7J0GWB5_9ERIC|nr:hypothetical protein Acr_24g0013300 [Actinidia rufa]